MSVPSTPSRRSQRGQPIPLSPSKLSRSSQDDQGLAWIGKPIHTRPVDPRRDILDSEQAEAWNDQDEEEKEALETTFYEGFSKVASSAAPKRPGTRTKGQTEQGNLETFRVGDTVLVNTMSLALHKQPSIAVIVAMWETDMADDSRGPDEKMQIQIHWFIRPTEMASIRAKKDTAENEIYYSLTSTTIVTPSSVLCHCTVNKSAKTATGKKPNPARLKFGPFFCDYAVDSRRGIFYDFSWVDQHAVGMDGDVGDPEAWNVAADDALVSTKAKKAESKAKKKESKDGDEEIETKSPAKKTKSTPKGRGRGKGKGRPTTPTPDPESDGGESDYNASESEDCPTEDDVEEKDEGESEDAEDPYALPQTPKSKKRKRSGEATPRKKSKRMMVQPTPHSKAALSKRKKQFALPKLDYKNQANAVEKLPKDPWIRALHMLHVGSRPDALPCREEQYADVLKDVSDLLEEGSGGCVYISGVPGTGKTATVHAIIRELKRMAEESEINPFTYVEINGLRIPEPNAAYTVLWETLSGHDAKNAPMRISAKESLKNLTKYFSGGSGRGRGPGEHACVVLMDELDQLVTAKQDVIYNFFNWPTIENSKLVVIAVANTHDLSDRVMTGRVRSRLGMKSIKFMPYKGAQLETIVRARLESACEGLDLKAGTQTVMRDDAVKIAAQKVASISGDARRVLDICRHAVELMESVRQPVVPRDVLDVIKEMQNSPTAAYLEECSLHERILLASLIKCIKREGVEEIAWGEVQYQHLRYVNSLTSIDDPSRKPTPHELVLALQSLAASRAILMEEGATAMRKAEGERKIVLNLEQGEVERVLSDVGGQAWKNVLSN